MQKIMSWKRLILILSLLSVLTACGLKGDLYIPEDQAATSSGS
jgi:predicted small lipoprotein YifL